MHYKSLYMIDGHGDLDAKKCHDVVRLYGC